MSFIEVSLITVLINISLNSLSVVDQAIIGHHPTLVCPCMASLGACGQDEIYFIALHC